MKFVIKESLFNTLITYLGFIIGGINTLFLYVYFIGQQYYGLVTYLQSAAVLLLPIVSFAMQFTLVKFYSSYNTQKERDIFLWSSLLTTLLLTLLIGVVCAIFLDRISEFLSVKNNIIERYVPLIFVLSISMGYFELFYAWSKVQLKSIFGNFLKEVLTRVFTSLLLIAVSLDLLSLEFFVYSIVWVYILRMILMLVYALYLHRPKFYFQNPKNIKELLRYSVYMILAGSVGTILLEIDKFMIPHYKNIENVSYYSVAIYIATVVVVPTRAFQQIINPLTAKALNKGMMYKVQYLYKESSLYLFIIGGLTFILINTNILDLYRIINSVDYNKGIVVVFIISIAKLIEMLFGIGNTILTNSKYFRAHFYLSLAMALSVIFLNRWMIELFDIKGAALATLSVVFIFTIVKGLYLFVKMKLQPFSIDTLKIGFSILMTFLVCYFTPFSFQPVLNILLRSILAVLIYLSLIRIFGVVTTIFWGWFK